jgi:hypothetical protein
MRAVDQWTTLEQELREWERARLAFRVEDPEAMAAAAAVLAPLGPGRAGDELRFEIARDLGGAEKLRNLLGRLDRKRIWGGLEVVEVTRRAEAPAAAARGTTLAAGWDAEVSRLPEGWRDLLCELEVDSTDYLARAALLGAPLNPTRNPNAIALRFRVSRGGYGTAPGMARRCLERMDEDGITGGVRVLTVLSDTDNVGTLGPVWRVAGRSV